MICQRKDNKLLKLNGGKQKELKGSFCNYVNKISFANLFGRLHHATGSLRQTESGRGGIFRLQRMRRRRRTHITCGFYDSQQSGEGGIRTHGPRKGTPVFETGAFGHSATSP